MSTKGFFVASYVFPDTAEGRIVIDAKVKLSGSKERHPISAKIDTGADRSCVSKKLAKELGLVSDKTARIYSATGTKIVPCYEGLDLILANVENKEKIYRNLEVFQFSRANDNVDFIIGQDIIRTWDLTISNSKGKHLVFLRTPCGKSHIGFSMITGEVKDLDLPLSTWEQLDMPEGN